MRSLTGSYWVLKDADRQVVRALSDALGISQMTARALICRGVTEVGKAQAFLGIGEAGVGSLTLQHDPFQMRDMDGAVAAVLGALGRGARIRVYGDYDVDGVCATALLVRALRGLAANGRNADATATSEIDYYIPHRVDEGYGVNEDAVRQAHVDGIGLLITVDCGSTAVAPIGLARELGIEVVVTDHHHIDADASCKLAPLAPVLNPCQADCGYPFKELAGVGVAFKLVTALGRSCGLADDQALNFLDLVCLGTVADVVPLLGENRLFVQHGLLRLPGSKKVGVRALMEAAAVGKDGTISARDVAFGLAPRINAAGRMEDARAAVELLLTRDRDEARALAEQLCAHNDARRAEERQTFVQAQKMVAAEIDLSREKVIVLASEDWHPGVIGIVASRLVEQYFRPVLLVALSDGSGKGSGRSIPAFDLWEGLRECEALLTRFGGHRFAAGFGIEMTHLPELRQRINEVAEQRLSGTDLTRQIQVDAEVTLAELGIETASELERLAPFGMGNPAPVLVARGVRMQQISRVGDGSHVSLRLSENAGATMGAIWFRAGELGNGLTAGAEVDVCFRPKIDEWGGEPRVQLQIIDVAV